MLSVILKRNAPLKEIQLTQYNLINDMWDINGAELLTEDTWAEGLAKVRTPFVCLVEGDCYLPDGYLLSLLRTIMDDGRNPEKGTGGYTKLAMVSPSFNHTPDERMYHYQIEGNEVCPSTEERPVVYSPQVGFVPGAILRVASIKGSELSWDEPNLVKLSALVSTYLWGTGRRVRVNPGLIYYSSYAKLGVPCLITVPDKARELFERERL